jgi:hypothetical protein
MDSGPYVTHLFGEAVQEQYRVHRGWLTAAAYSSIPWPQEDVVIRYDGDDYFLRGVNDKTGRMSAPAITMRCAKDKTNEILGKIYRFASVLGWFKRGYVDIGSYATSSHPILYSEATHTGAVLAGGPEGFNCNYMPLIRDEATRRALAYWREGSRLHRLHTGYAFLSFFKVIESQFGAAKRKRTAWIEKAIPTLEGDVQARVQELLKERLDVGKHVYESGRCAVAHAAFSDGRGDPDIPEDRIRLSKDIGIIRSLAMKYITEVLKVPDEMEVYRTRDRLLPLRSIISASHLASLRSGEHVSRRHVGLQGLKVGVAMWPNEPIAQLANLRLRVVEVRDGQIWLEAHNDASTVRLGFVLDAKTGRAHVDLEATAYTRPTPGSPADDAVAVVEFRKAVIGNGAIEIWLPDGGRIDCEILIPVNIDIVGTFKNMEAEIASLRALEA